MIIKYNILCLFEEQNLGRGDFDERKGSLHWNRDDVKWLFRQGAGKCWKCLQRKRKLHTCWGNKNSCFPNRSHSWVGTRLRPDAWRYRWRRWQGRLKGLIFYGNNDNDLHSNHGWNLSHLSLQKIRADFLIKMNSYFSVFLRTI